MKLLYTGKISKHLTYNVLYDNKKMGTLIVIRKEFLSQLPTLQFTLHTGDYEHMIEMRCANKKKLWKYYKQLLKSYKQSKTITFLNKNITAVSFNQKLTCYVINV